MSTDSTATAPTSGAVPKPKRSTLRFLRVTMVPPVGDDVAVGVPLAGIRHIEQARNGTATIVMKEKKGTRHIRIETRDRFDNIMAAANR